MQWQGLAESRQHTQHDSTSIGVPRGYHYSTVTSCSPFPRPSVSIRTTVVAIVGRRHHRRVHDAAARIVALPISSMAVAMMVVVPPAVAVAVGARTRVRGIIITRGGVVVPVPVPRAVVRTLVIRVVGVTVRM